MEHGQQKIGQDSNAPSQRFSSLTRRKRNISFIKHLIIGVILLLTIALIAWPQLNPVEKHLKLSFTKITEGESGKPHMLHPKFQGVDEHGQSYTIYADSATQEEDDKVIVKEIHGDITLKDNGWVRFSADGGIVKVKQGWASLSGNVNAISDEHYILHTENIEVQLKAGVASGQVPLIIEGPIGILEATGFVLDNNAGTIIFSGPVKMVVHPDKGGV